MTNEQIEFGARMFAAFAHPARLRILEYLARNPASVNEIAVATDQKQSITSQHLSDLLEAGILVCTPNGNKRIYSLRGQRIAKILQLVEEFYEVHLDAWRDLVAGHRLKEI